MAFSKFENNQRSITQALDPGPCIRGSQATTTQGMWLPMHVVEPKLSPIERLGPLNLSWIGLPREGESMGDYRRIALTTTVFTDGKSASVREVSASERGLAPFLRHRCRYAAW